MISTVRKRGPLALLVLALSGILYARFARLLACPSCYLFNDAGDGLKNYFTPAWFVEHDTGLWFCGMNYPYGEHIVYTDNQPAWSVLMKLIDSVFPMGEHVIGSINMLMVLSVLVAGILLYAIMREMGLPRWYAALLSVPITLLSPQIERFNGHYSLAHLWYVPLLIFLFVRWTKTNQRLKYSALLVAAIVWVGFTHLYFLFIAAILLVSFAFVRWILNRFRPDALVMGALAITLISGTLIYGTVKVTDPVVDRPQEVYGLYVYTAKAEGTFLPWYEPVGTFLREELKIKKPDVEGLNYIGAAGTLLLPFVLVWCIWHIRRKRRRSGSIPPGHPLVLVLTSLLVWLAASGWIYSLGVIYLVDVFPVLGQFRSLGRLGWLFYYLILLVVAYWGYIALRGSRGKLQKIAVGSVFGLLLAFWIWEGVGHLWQSTSGIFRQNERFKRSTPYTDLLNNHRIDPATFQGLLQVPLFSAGAEKFSLSRGSWPMRETMQCSWETGLPIVDSYLSRTSVSQSLDLLQLISHPAIPKKRLEAMDERPLLLIANSEKLVSNEQRLIEQSTMIGTVNNMRLLSMPLDILYDPSDDLPAYESIYENHFDQISSDLALRGSGAHWNTEKTVLVNMRDSASQAGTWAFSLWAWVAEYTPGFPVIRHETFNAKGERIYNQQHSQFTYEPVNVIGHWVEVRIPFNVSGSGHLHRFTLESEGILVDELAVIDLD